MKILVVDDDIVSRMALADVVQGLGPFQIQEAEDGQQAWDILQTQALPLFCCCDIRMPGLSGLDLLQKMQGDLLLRRLPMILVSSASDMDTVQQAIRGGATDYIIKPFKALDARAHLQKILNKIWSAYCETPVATMKRLNLAPQRLLAYYGALQNQLNSAQTSLMQTISQKDHASTKSRVDTLHTGCITLGLWHAASEIEQLRNPNITPALLNQILQSVLIELAQQIRIASNQSKT